MALNPFREALAQAGLRAFQLENTFKPEADASLARFRALREALERRVAQGDLTPKVAREKAAAAAADLQDELLRRAADFSTTPRAFFDRVVEASDARKRARDRLSLEGLQRETNRLLRLSLVEQQLQSRSHEFEGRAYSRPLAGGPASPTVDSLLVFHESAIQSGDEAAAEWARRQLEAIRPTAAGEADQRRIDLACDRPDVVNPRIVASYMAAMKPADPSAMEEFVSHAIEGGDANACVASYLMAREQPGGAAVRWVRDVLNGFRSFPDAALATARTVEAEARDADAEAARVQAEFALAVARAESELAGVQAPSESDLALKARLLALPVARLGEPIGLNPVRRGLGGALGNATEPGLVGDHGGD